MASAIPTPVRAFSWHKQQKFPYKPCRTTPRKSINPSNLSIPSFSVTKTASSVNLTSSSNRAGLTHSVSDLTIRRSSSESENTYMGYDQWSPSSPKVEKKPRPMYNAASLAYIGDCVYELYARRHFLFPPLNIEEYNDRVMAVVRCEAQDAMLQKLINEDILSAEERDVLRWGKNIGSAKTRTKKRAGVAVYNRASSLEALIGYLYLTNVKRLEEIMMKLGFSTGASEKSILDEANSGQPTVSAYTS